MADQPHNGAGAGSLFTTDAVDNAEVVPDDAASVRESMWTTAANTDSDDDVVDVQVEQVAGVDTAQEPPPGRAWGVVEEPWGPPPTRPTTGPMWDEGVFSPEPIDYEDDVIDAGDPTIDTWGEDTVIRTAAGGGPLFSSGPAAEPATDAGPWHEVGSATFGAGGAARPAEDPTVSPFESAAPAAGPDAGTAAQSAYTGEAALDLNGIGAAVAAMGADEAERVAVPLMIVAALLEPGERVERVVAGKMLGRPTAVVLTASRLLVANDRRWDPAVDVYALDGELMVRGRRDDHVAAMTFADDEQMSMVDDIVDADGAVELAEIVRQRTAN